MKKTTVGAHKSAKRGLLLVSTLVSVVMYAQTEKEISAIRAVNDAKQASKFKLLREKQRLTPETLKAKAKKLNLKYFSEFEGKTFQLVGFDDRDMPLYYQTFNADAAVGTGTTILNDQTGIYKLDGAGINIYEWDGGAVRVKHTEFEGRAVQVDNATTVSDHATHVGGTMIAAGLDGKAKGMAYRANLKAHYWDNDIDEMLVGVNNGALVSNHSYGYSGGFVYSNVSGTAGWHWYGKDEDDEFIGFGQYISTDAQWDYLQNFAPYYLPVKAAGNPRGDGPSAGGKYFVRINGVWTETTKPKQKNGGADGFDTVNNGSTSKNTLIVGAAHKLSNGYTGPQDVKAASFSGFGPTDDGRIKPDIVGIGVDIYSLNSTTNSAYTTMSGTSMASPNVTGNLALLQQHHHNLYSSYMKASTLKGLVIHTAKEAGGFPGPDYSFGWGLLDAKKAADVILAKNSYASIKESDEEKLTTTNPTKEYNLVASGTEPLKVTLTWVDPAAKVLSNSSVLDDPTSMLVNDLDIKILDTANNTYLPWVLNPQQPAAAATTGDNTRDNVEQIVINNPTAGASYKLIVSHKGTLKKNEIINKAIDLVDSDEQAFSLIITGLQANLAKDIEVTEVKVLAEEKTYSTNTPVSVSFRNLGTDAIANAVVNVVVKNKDTGEELETKSFTINNLNVGESRTENLTLDFTKPFVNYDIQAKAELSGDQLEVNNIAFASAYSTVVDLTPAQSSHRFGFENNFLKNGWTSEDIDGDGRTWRQYTSPQFAKEGNNFAINFAGLNTGSNDWFFSNPLKMSANTKYIVSFHTSKLRALEEPLQVFFGKEANATAMTTQVSPVISTTANYVHHIYEITPTEDGIFHFGFNNKVDAGTQSYAVFLDDVIIKRAEDKPVAGFSANNLTPTTFDNVSLKNETADAPSSAKTYEWTISPNNVQFITGNANSESPVVRFTAEGTYEVSLKVSNAYGSDTETKTGYITVANEATQAVFSANKTSIFEGEEITFSNASTGNPSPTAYKWTITPSEGITFTNGNTAKNPTVKFDKGGKYTVSLTATSPMNEATETKTDYIEVKSYYEPVRQLTGTLDQNTKDVTLKWVRPILLDNYSEGFENNGQPAPNYTFIDGNNDGKGWTARKNINAILVTIKFAHSGTYGMVSMSADESTGTGIDADNWMFTDKLKAGSEVLKFYAYAPHPYPEDLEIYAIPAPASGQSPTLADIKPEHKVFDKTLKNVDFEEVVVDLKGKTDEDFFLAFYHKTKKEADAFFLAIDDVSVGYDNSLPQGGESKPEEELKVATKEDIQNIKNGSVLYRNEAVQSVPNGELITYAATNYPALKGYKVFKNDTELQTINDVKTLTTTDNVASNTGIVKYDLVALYSDGKNSTKETVTIDLTNLATVEQNTSATQVYPNPSTGLFTIDAGSGSSSFTAKVYDMSGKLVLDKVSKEQKAQIDLTPYGTGVYILNVTMDNGKNVSVKLMVK